jgi:archaellum component FlaC
MFNLDTAASLAQIMSVTIAASLGVYGIWRRIDKRQTESQIATIRINDKLDRIENQFGPNGGGIREAVNTMSAKIDKIETRVNTIDTKLANVAGKFDQHIVETDN